MANTVYYSGGREDVSSLIPLVDYFSLEKLLELMKIFSN